MALNSFEKYMKMCFALAKKGGHKVLPNPLVGCVIVKEGKIISKGYHMEFGGFHAERNAILNAKENIEGADLYVNLEPCSHFGKTPPCTDLIIEKKIKRVIYSISDPNSKVEGKKALKKAGIEVVKGVLENEGEELNKVFIKNITKKIPYVAIKTAITLDSKISDKNYNSKWITGEKARIEVMKLRSFYQAIITGSNTVIKDNPRLTSRIKGGINPIRIVMDKKGVLKGDENVFNEDGTRVIVINNSKKSYPSHIEKIEFENMENLLKNLYEIGVYSLMVESGAGLVSAFIKEKAADEIYSFVAPKILGGGLDFVSGLDLEIKNFIPLKLKGVKKFDEDLLLNYKLNWKGQI